MLKRIFLEGWKRRLTRNGSLCNLRYEKIFPGVYEIWFEEDQ
jgi:hypothetical protein